MDKIYINPITGRLIKKNSKKYNELKSRHFKLKKSPCLYNETSAKKCLEKIFKYYPKLPIPSKTLNNNITVIRNKDRLVNGVVAENGQMYKLEYPIKVDANVPELITVSENHNEMLNKKLKSVDVLSTDYIQNKLNNKVSGENVIYNPLQDNYIDQVITQPILNEINKRVIPETLPSIGINGVSGVIRDKDNLDEITGYVNEKNEALKLSTTLKVQVSELQKELNIKNTEINDLKKQIQLNVSNPPQTKVGLDSSYLSKLNAQLIKKENEKQQLEKQCTQKINTLYRELGELNMKIPKLEDSSKYYYSLIKRTLEKWSPIEDDQERYKSYATWLKDLFVGNKTLKKTDNIEENLDILVERANMYANSKRTNIELQKINNEYVNINKKLNEQLLEYPYQQQQIERLTKELNIANKRYNNAKITRDTLIESYEKSIKGYLNAIESLKENNVNIGVEMGLLKNKYNDIKELQEQLKNSEKSQDSESEYNFINKYFNVTQDYNKLKTLIEQHESTFKTLQDKNIKLEDIIKDLQRKLKDTSNVNIVNNLNIYKKAFKDIQTKYNNLIQENNINLKKIIDLNNQSDTLSNTYLNTKSELTRCKQEKLNKEKELNDHLTMSQSISLPRSITDNFKEDTKNIQDTIKKELSQQQCNGYLTNDVGIQYILKWNENVQKCIQEEIKCNENEIYNENKDKCIPCKDYNLIWDPITKQCIQQSINILVDENNNIIGESDDNWTEIRRPKNI